MKTLKGFKKDNEKRLFLSFGIFNFLITNFVLQVLLLLIPTILATVISQLVNLILGYYLYGKKVFTVNTLTKKQLLKYFFLSTIVWNLNWISIERISSTGLSKNIASLIMIIPLAIFSYIFQKYLIFQSKT